MTLKAMDLDVGLKNCETRASFATPDDSPATSSFELVVDRSCFEGAEGVMVCWSPRPEHCNVVAASPSLLRQGFFQANTSSLAELGQTLHTGLLAPRPLIEPDTLTPPHGDGAAPAGGALPTAELTDSDQQITDAIDSDQRTRYGWLLWAGAAALVAGLALGAGFLVARRNS